MYGDQTPRKGTTMAQWKAGYTYENVHGEQRDWLYFHAADSRTMKRKDLNAATRNAVKRAKERLIKRGVVKPRVFSINCVG